MLMRDALVNSKQLVKASSNAASNIIYSIEGPRRAHKDHMDGLVKDTRNAWRSARDAITPLAANYEAEFAKELSLLKSRCLNLIHKYVDAEVSHLQEIMLKERSMIIASFRKHFSTFDLHEDTLFNNFNREIQFTINEFQRVWGPVRPLHLPQFLKELESIPMVYLNDLRDEIFRLHGTIDPADDSILSRMEVADVLFTSLG